jgi:eukaryotic-like serine/threonine-protein kinase
MTRSERHPFGRLGNLTAKQFLQLLQQSGLVEDTAISPRLREWDAELAPTGGLAATTGLEVARRLVASRFLSVWQAEKLLSGKHKGYYLANYRIIDLLGITPWAAVYRAEHQLMRRAAVMEVLSDKLAAREDQRERFFRRARSVAELDHPNLVHMYDMGEERGMCYTVMEYVAGYNVRRLVRRLGPLPQDMAVGIVRQAGLGLQAVHAAGNRSATCHPRPSCSIRMEWFTS